MIQDNGASADADRASRPSAQAPAGLGDTATIPSAENPGIVLRRGGYFVTGTSWSGPWRTREAAELAMDGEYTLAHEEERRAVRVSKGSAQ